ncbi:MAG: hypothetical protein Q8M24_00440 [Pseudolabrys sp.]|nr:hypothetical protein [Pseudolabrys sp.]MDP2293914.1 hypothetical protein [Pseudolabrys sp.]
MPTKVKYDLRPYIESIKAFRGELMAHAEAREAFPIERIFQLLPINVITPGGRALVESRGNGLFDLQKRADGSFFFKSDSSRPDADKITFRDDCLGEIETTIPQVLSFSYTPGEEIQLVSADQEVVVHKIERLAQLPQEVVEKLFPLRLVSFAISTSRFVTTFKDPQNSLFILDGLIPIGASLKDYICEKWYVWAYSNEFDHSACTIQRSYGKKPAKSAYVAHDAATEAEAKKWATDNPDVCPIIENAPAKPRS